MDINTYLIAELTKAALQANPIEQPDWFSLWTAPQVIAALIAAIIGGLIAAYGKEIFGDSFHKRRRKREIRGLLFKNINLIYSTYIPYVEAFNRQKINDTLVKTLIESDNETGKNSTSSITEFRNEELKQSTMTTDLYKSVIEFESEIVCLIYEAEFYLNKEQNKLLSELLARIYSSLDSDQYKVLGYFNFNHLSLVEFYDMRFNDLLRKKLETIYAHKGRAFKDLQTIIK